MPHGALQMDPDALCKLREDYGRDAWKSASLLDFLGVPARLHASPIIGSEVIDSVCPLSLSLKNSFQEA